MKGYNRLVIFMVIILAGLIISKRFQPDSTEERGIETQLIAVALEVNKNCPLMIDAETQLDSASVGPGNVFRHNYTLVDATAAEVDGTALARELRPEIVRNAKSDPNMADFRKHRVTLVFDYHDRDGVLVASIEVTPADYKE